MQCAACERELEAFTGDVCPHCQHFAHPTRLGAYDNLELIKRGGMSSVYRARHPELGTVVAIKTVHTHAGPETLAERFKREASLAARIPHPGVVRVFDYDCQEGRLYLVMEFVEGATLRQCIGEDRPLDWILDKVAQLAEVLQTAHERGIVHRDIKPDNVMVDGTGRVRVLDFGISRLLEDGEGLTKTGEILGTPEYIAPEQILDVPEAVDARTDIYATGVVLYELLTAHSPFAGTNVFQVLKNVESLTPPPPSQLRPGLDGELDSLVMQCMAREKERRPADSRALARRLRELGASTSPSAPPRRGALVGVAVVCLVAGFLAAQWWPGRVDGGSVATQPTSVATIRAILSGPMPYDRYALSAASRSIPDEAPPQELYWRAMARKFTGSLFLALRDFEHARDAGHQAATTEAAILWIYKHRLFPKAVPGGSVLVVPCKIQVDGAGPLANGLRALAKDRHKEAAMCLDRVIDPVPDVAILKALARSQVDAPERIAPDYVPSRLLAAVHSRSGDHTCLELERILQGIDRLAPLRYLLEAAVAAHAGDDTRLKAALELAQVTGEAHFAMSVYVAIQLSRFDRLGDAERTALRALAKDLRGEIAEVLQRAVGEKLNGR